MGVIHGAKSFEHLVGALHAFSERQLRSHLDLYLGYIRKLNEIEDRLEGADRTAANATYSEYSELQRRRPYAYNAAYLHELFFESLTDRATRPSDALLEAIERDFDTLDSWFSDASAALLSGNGWVLLCRSRHDGRLRNALVEDHDVGLMVGQDVLLALDGWEHAYAIDHGANKVDYLNALERAIDWERVSARYDVAARDAWPVDLEAA